ncbi:T9SS type A sorting domain-containing protein, partial [bacterium]|nr:T9SS type A sorting domain-containing protein [bacterium]
YVPFGQTLTIEAGVVVNFSYNTKFRVNGGLQVHGAEDDSVEFRGLGTGGTGGDWQGIVFFGNLPSTIRYSVISFGEWNIKIRGGGNATIENSRIHYPGTNSVLLESGQLTLRSTDLTQPFNNFGAGHSLVVTGGTLTFEGGSVNHPFSSSTESAVRLISSTATLRDVSVTGDCSYGINGQNQFSLTLDGCRVIGFDRAVYLDNCSNSVIKYNVIARSSAACLWIRGGGNIAVHDNTIEFAGYPGVSDRDGVLLSLNASLSQFTNNIIANCTGVGVNNSNGNVGSPADYNCFSNNSDGNYAQGNLSQNDIEANPLFVSSANGNYNLQYNSPCINAGYPSRNDPDGTRSDIGAHFYNLNQPPVIEEYVPDVQLLTGYSWGDEIDFSVTASDPNQHALSYRWYVADELVSEESSVTVALYDNDTVRVEVDDGFYLGVTAFEWFVDELPTPEVSEDGLPAAFAIESVFPNPFNVQTQVRIALPHQGLVRVAVYDLLGREVQTVTNEWGAGRHMITVGGAEWSSGLYFLRAQYGTESAVRKLTLIK